MVRDCGLVAACQPLSEEDLSLAVEVGRKMRQLGKNERVMQLYFLKNTLYRKRHTARGSGNRGGPCTFALRKASEGREGETPIWDVREL